MTSLIPLVPLFIAIGAAIGLTGIGGVLLLPTLVYIGGLGVHEALPVCLASFLFSGVAGSWMQSRRAALDRSGGLLLAAAGVGSALGIWLSGLVSGTWPMAILGVVALLSGWTGLVLPHATGREVLGTGEAVGLGAPVGALSAITGTGGPVLLVPLMVILRRPPHMIVALAQLVQLPIAGMGTLTAIALGHGSVFLALFIGPALAIGVVAGSLIKSRVPATLLGRFLAVAMLLFGAVTILRTVVGGGLVD